MRKNGITTTTNNKKVITCRHNWRDDGRTRKGHGPTKTATKHPQYEFCQKLDIIYVYIERYVYIDMWREGERERER